MCQRTARAAAGFSAKFANDEGSQPRMPVPRLTPPGNPSRIAQDRFKSRWLTPHPPTSERLLLAAGMLSEAPSYGRFGIDSPAFASTQNAFPLEGTNDANEDAEPFKWSPLLHDFARLPSPQAFLFPQRWRRRSPADGTRSDARSARSRVPPLTQGFQRRSSAAKIVYRINNLPAPQKGSPSFGGGRTTTLRHRRNGCSFRGRARRANSGFRWPARSGTGMRR
jgi:hypothetical protein